MAERRTANERFKARAGRHFWAAGIIAVVALAVIDSIAGFVAAVQIAVAEP